MDAERIVQVEIGECPSSLSLRVFLEKSIDAHISVVKAVALARPGRIPPARVRNVIKAAVTKANKSLCLRGACRDDIALAREIINDYGFSHAAEEAARIAVGGYPDHRLPGAIESIASTYAHRTRHP